MPPISGTCLLFLHFIFVQPQWIHLQRGNNDGKDFDKDFLSEIFDRIAAEVT